MIHRQKILIALVQELGGKIAAEKLHLLLFLYCHEFMENNHYYDFIFVEDGVLSLQAQEDKKSLISKKWLESGGDWVAMTDKPRVAVDIDFFEKTAFQKMKNQQLPEMSCEELQQRIKSQHVLVISKSTEPTFFTIGYEGKSLEAFLNLLLQQGVKLLCDVRKNAYSHKYGFSKRELETGLALVGILYQHIPELGIVSEKRQKLETAADYRALFVEYDAEVLPKQQAKLEMLKALLEQHQRIAITCFEADPYCCHRSRITAALKQQELGYPIVNL